MSDLLVGTVTGVADNKLNIELRQDFVPLEEEHPEIKEMSPLYVGDNNYAVGIDEFNELYIRKNKALEEELKALTFEPK